MHDKKLVFLISQPRSGSTLLQTLLSNHSQISTHSETWILLPTLGAFSTNISSSYNETYAKNAIKEFVDNTLGEENFRNEVLNFFLRIFLSKTPEGNYFLDKTPRYYEILNQIIEYFPNSKILVLKRNPIDVLLSIISSWKQDKLWKLYTYQRDILKAPFLIQSFLEQNANNKNIFECCYENILIDSKREISNILNWLNLDLETNCFNINDAQLLGNYGDEKIKNLNTIINNKERKAINKRTKELLLGYAHFLGKDFLNNYGYTNIESKETLLFNLFKFVCNRKIPEIESSRKDFLKNLYYRIMLNLKKA